MPAFPQLGPKAHRFLQGADNRCAFDGCGGFRHEHEHQLDFPASPQPAPTGNGPEVLPVVLGFLTRRQEHGRAKYGTTLRAHNGRDALQDAVEEAADKLMYLMQLRMQWPALVAQVRHDALEEALQLVELQLQADPEGQETELDRTTAAVNGAVRRVYAGLRGLQGKPPAEPEAVKTGPRKGLPRRMRKPHRWYRAQDVERCRDCPLQRDFRERGPRGGPMVIYRQLFVGGGQWEELDRGSPHLVRVPACPPAPKDVA